MDGVPSIRIRQKFREYLVGTMLRYIDDVFRAALIGRGEVPPGKAVSGQRRSLVEEYYAGVNWQSSADVRKVLSAFSHVLADAPPGKERDDLIAALRTDGFTVEDSGAITLPRDPVSDVALNIADPEALLAYERRIQQNVVDDPDLAIGSSKELIEAVCKLLLEDANVALGSAWRRDSGSAVSARPAKRPGLREKSVRFYPGDDLLAAIDRLFGTRVCRVR